MKLYLRSAALAFAVLLGTAVFAADKPADKPADPKDARKGEKCDACKEGEKCDACKEGKEGKCEKCSEKPKLVMLTGSRIPQRITQYGRITDGIHPVSVYSREDLESTGANDTAEALRRLSPALR